MTTTEKGEERILGWIKHQSEESYERQGIVKILIDEGTFSLEEVQDDDKGAAIQIEIQDLMKYLAEKLG